MKNIQSLAILTVFILLMASNFAYAENSESSPQYELGGAASSGNLDSVRKLVEKGADVNAEDYKDNTALMYAADEGAMAHPLCTSALICLKASFLLLRRENLS